RTMGQEQWTNIPRSLVYTLCQWHRIPLLRARTTRELIRVIKTTVDDRRAIEHLENIINDNFGFFLFQAIEKAKCELSDWEQTMISFTERDLRINEEIGKSEFESLNKDNLQQIAACIDGVVVRSGLLPAQVDTVFLTGGTSRIPRIQALFAERFGRDKLENRDAFTSVVHGLGSSVPLFV
ncbi:MAG: Hsp70 family protein, partial [Desulfuromonadaceae bacterium]